MSYVEFDSDKLDAIFRSKDQNELMNILDKYMDYCKRWLNHNGIFFEPDYNKHVRIGQLAGRKRLKELAQEKRFKLTPRKMNKTQLRALLKIFNRQNFESPSHMQYKTFLQMRRATEYSFMDCHMINIFGIWIGIEKDGYTHS